MCQCDFKLKGNRMGSQCFQFKVMLSRGEEVKVELAVALKNKVVLYSYLTTQDITAWMLTAKTQEEDHSHDQIRLQQTISFHHESKKILRCLAPCDSLRCISQLTLP